MRIRLIINIIAVCFILSMSACSHKPTDKLVGNDRDEHGCIASAGYRWSEVRKDCIRIWEAGRCLTNGDKKVYVVFGNDSARAEVYLDDGRCIMCNKVNGIWTDKKGSVKVVFSNGTLKVCVEGTYYSIPNNM